MTCDSEATHAFCDSCVAARTAAENAADAYRRGAEAMREAAARLFDGAAGIPSLAKIHGFRDFIRNLPIPEDK